MAKKATFNGQQLPLPIGDRAAFIRKASVAVDIVDVPTAMVVTYSVAYDRVEVAHIPLSEIGGRQYYLDGDHTGFGPAGLAKTHLSWLRSQALSGGATPEAVRLLAKATGAFTKKEEATMAEKLKSKAAPRKANAKALKEAASKTPVGGGKPTSPKRKGNAEALKKAREAKGPDTRKITALKKPKDIEARAGSFRHSMLVDLLGSKTVQEFRDKNSKYDAGCIRYAVDAGYIKELPAKA